MADKQEKNRRKKDENKPAKAKDKKENFLVHRGKAIIRYFRDMRSELKKVTWPTGKQVVRNTLVVLLIVLVIGVLIWIFDWLAAAVVKALVNLF